MTTSVITSAAVLGASGQVGGHVVRNLLLLSTLKSLTLVSRRPLDEFKDDARVKHILLPEMTTDAVNSSSTIQKLEQAGVQAAFCAMGVGKASKATPEELMRIDVEVPVAFASACKQAGATHASLLTSVGADVTASSTPSMIMGTSAGGSYYTHCKGKVEAEYAKLGFESVAAYRPSTITGNENTPGVIDWLAPKLDCLLPARFKSANIRGLGAAMVAGANRALQNKGPAFSAIEGQHLFDLFPKTSAGEL